MRKGRRRGRIIPILVATFYLGCAAGWWLHASFSQGPPAFLRAGEPDVGARPDSTIPNDEVSEAPVQPTTGVAEPATTTTATKPLEKASGSEPIWRPDPIVELSRRDLRLPIDEASIALMKGSFGERRSGGSRGHEAVDILAPRNTPVHAVESGIIAKLFYSKAGGTTVYQFDPSEHFCYYYAHLQAYASGLHEGQRISEGEVLGYVGTSGNAPPGTPHLHFAIFELTPEKRWWDGRAVDPYLVFKRTS